jgi:hypothetical protein
MQMQEPEPEPEPEQEPEQRQLQGSFAPLRMTGIWVGGEWDRG